MASAYPCSRVALLRVVVGVVRPEGGGRGRPRARLRVHHADAGARAAAAAAARGRPPVAVPGWHGHLALLHGGLPRSSWKSKLWHTDGLEKGRGLQRGSAAWIRSYVALYIAKLR